MKLLNYTYYSDIELKKFIEDNSIEDSNSTLIQIFASNRTKEAILEIKDKIKSLLPNSSIILTTTAGIVNYGNIIDDAINISFSLFEISQTKDCGYINKSVDEIIVDLEENYIQSDTKLLIAFANTLKFDATKLLAKLTIQYPKLVVVGGNSGDDFNFKECVVASSQFDDVDIVFSIVNSDKLMIETGSLFNWETIGKSMVVTKSEGAKVCQVDGKPIMELYEHYLGKAVSQNLFAYGIQFPLVYEENGTKIARALVAYDEVEGSITFAGTIPEGQEVKFGYANLEYIENQNSMQLLNKHNYKNEAVLIYTCAARRQMLRSFLNNEINTLNLIGDSAGFTTYGEFFHNKNSCENNLLNITTTYVTLNEKPSFDPISINPIHENIKDSDVKVGALTTLLKKTSEELDENIHYLEQFKNSVESASIFSTTNEKGVITYVNKNFEDISGYSRDELIGKSHNIVRYDEMPKELFEEMWETIKSGEIWKGVVKNKKKDGSSYYVVSEIAPIYNKDGSLKEYIGIRSDVTELEEYKLLLKHELDVSKESLDENINYIKQYEEAMNLATAVMKTDTSNKITFVNEKFTELSGYRSSELIGTNAMDIRHPLHNSSEDGCLNILQRLHQNEKVYETMTNLSKNGKEFITNTLFYPIKDTSKNITEYVQIMFDVTDIYRLNEEIINTQKEVVEKMGAIGETRSKETGDHVKRVAEYSYLLAKLNGLSESEAILLKQASPMHDIGKVGIPDHILKKPGKLTVEEFEVMKTHAEIGYEMLKNSTRDILQASATVAYTHHEKWDGSGYPRGLKGEDIHIFGRITAIADVFDALGHDRVYKKAWEMDRILELFENEKGKHFDPILVDLLFENLEQFLYIKKDFDNR